MYRCANKQTYFTEDDAYAARASIKKRKGRQLYVYHCDQCTFYHLTSEKPKDVKND